MIAIVDQADPKFVVQAIEIFGGMKDLTVAMCLLKPCLSEKSDPAVRQAAARQIRLLTDGVPDRAAAVRLLTETAKAYFNRQQPVEGVVNGRVDLWHWNAAKRQCVAASVTPDVATRAMAARCARDAFAIAPDDNEVRVLYLATLLEQAAYENGLDRSLDENDAALLEAKRFGVKALDEVLQYAMAHDHPAAAAATARLLGQIGNVEKLLSRGVEPAPLVRAVESPDRRLRMAALEAIVRLQPLRPFPGSGSVPEALGFFAASSGFRRALVACPNLGEARDLAGLLATAGFQVDTYTNGKDLLFQAARSPDYELALIDVTIDRPVAGILVQQLRHDSRTALLRVGLIARSGYFDRAERLAELDPLAKALLAAARRQGTSLATRPIGRLGATGIRRLRGAAAASRRGPRPAGRTVSVVADDLRLCAACRSR